MEPHKNRNRNRKRKRKKTHRGSRSSTVDRLSALPDCLLHLIMSRMKARQTVQTCVLSRRWRHLWRSAPCLHLHWAEFFEPSHGLPTQEELHPPREQLARFQSFGDSLLLNREPGSALDTLSLRLRDTHASRMDAGRWMRHACNLSSLRALRYEIFGVGESPARMPPDLGPSLTRLHLGNLSLDERFAGVVASVCVALEVMELEVCEIACRRLASNSLRSLVIDGGYIDGDDGHGDYQLVITAPRLASLRLMLDWGNEFLTVRASPATVVTIGSLLF